MIPFIFCLLALLPAVTGICYSPLMRGFAPDVILPPVISSNVRCPGSLVFDPVVCLCVDPTDMTRRMPTAGRSSLELSLLGTNRLPKTNPAPAFKISDLAGLPDMHSHRPSNWRPVTPFDFARSPTGGDPSRMVPVMNPYGSVNVPANSNVVKAAAKAKVKEAAMSAKEHELIQKIQWQEQLKREAEVAVELVAASAAVRASRSRGVGSALDTFMRDTLRRILYGY